MSELKQGRVKHLINKPRIIASASCVGKNEAEGPLKDYFDICFPDDGIGQSSWEKAEAELMKQSIDCVLKKAELTFDDIDIVFAGDLLNQCTSSNYTVRNKNVPFAGLFGACSTMAYSVALASVFVDGNYAKRTIAATSSHFCSAEKQFRYPLEYGSQRTPAAQRTVTGSGAFVIGLDENVKIEIPRVIFGNVIDYGIKDTSNMGAAMAPAAADTIAAFLIETDTKPEEYDLILTGDLGKVGSEILCELITEKYNIDIEKVHNDCGLLIYDLENQDVNSGGSGCGCSACVVASYITDKMLSGEYKKVLFVGTGALMSPLISLQGESIPAVAHAVELNLVGGK